MRIQGLILALIASGTVSSQTLSANDLLEALLTADSIESIAASGIFDSIDPAAYGFLAPLLAGWISSVRDESVQRGVENIPNDVRDVLVGYVPQDILDSVRWRVDARVFSIGQVQAATFDHVVLFASTDAANDVKVWVHELYHVMQYREWGVEAFSLRYIENRAEIENDAWDYLWDWTKAGD